MKFKMLIKNITEKLSHIYLRTNFDLDFTNSRFVYKYNSWQIYIYVLDNLKNEL